MFNAKHKGMGARVVEYFNAMATEEERKMMKNSSVDGGGKKKLAKHLSNLVAEILASYYPNPADVPNALKGKKQIGAGSITDRHRELVKLKVEAVKLVPEASTFAVFRKGSGLETSWQKASNKPAPHPVDDHPDAAAAQAQSKATSGGGGAAAARRPGGGERGGGHGGATKRPLAPHGFFAAAPATAARAAKRGRGRGRGGGRGGGRRGRGGGA